MPKRSAQPGPSAQDQVSQDPVASSAKVSFSRDMAISCSSVNFGFPSTVPTGMELPQFSGQSMVRHAEC